MAKHTPGPWVTMKDGEAGDADGNKVGIFRVIGNNNLVCESCYEADARLIAAAPELVEALERFCQIASGEPFDLTDSPKSLVTRINENRNDARALLRKIKGE